MGSGNDRQIPRTIVVPNPGGAAPETREAPTARTPEIAHEATEARTGVNPLVDAASDLFDLIVYLRGQTTPVETAPLRGKILALLKEFEVRAAGAGVEPGSVQVARYAIAATIDDEVMSLPWGMNSGWQHSTLVGALYDEVIGGERFFEYLAEAQSDPDRYGDLIEFMYLCISLGFQGVYRRRGPGGLEELEAHRAKAFRAIRNRRSGFAEQLSVRWRGVETQRKPLRELVPTWLAASIAVLVVAVGYFWAVYMAGNETGRAVAQVQQMPPAAEVAVATLEPPAPKEEIKYVQPQKDRVSGFLEPEIRQGLVEVFEAGGRVRVRVVGEGMFASGSATLQETFEPVLTRVAEALNDEPGEVILEGHSDAAPISTARFPSNFHLSEARAEAVAAFMRPILEESERLQVVGYGERYLLDPENPRSAANRRVELVLARPEGEQ